MKKHVSYVFSVIMVICMISAVFFGCSDSKLTKISLIYTLPPDAKETRIDEKAFWSDSELRKSFERYWAARYTKDMVKASFAIEAPYFQEMVDEQRYNVYIGSAYMNIPTEIRLQRMTKETDNLRNIDFVLQLKLTNGEIQDVFFTDTWLKVRGKWYHVLKDPLVFPAAS